MGDVHIRNVRVEGDGGHLHAEQIGLWMHREMFELGHWQQIDIDADAAWASASNILVSLIDFSVLTANIMQVTSVVGGFTAAHEGLMLSLFASDDSNRGMYNIRRVIDSNTLLVDERTRAGNWSSDESGITGRIHKASTGLAFTGTGSYFVVQAPAASGHNLQLHYTHDGYDNVFVKAYPHGDYAGAALATSQVSLNRAYQDISRYNAFFCDAGAPEFYAAIYEYYDGVWYRTVTGLLTDVAVGDPDPAFLHYGNAFDLLADEPILQMLNELNTQTNFYPTFYKKIRDQNEDSKRESQLLAKKMNGNLAKVFRPLVIGANSANGGFMRGNTPHEFANQWYADDGFGTSRWKMGNHTLMPRDGVDDIKPMATLAA